MKQKLELLKLLADETRLEILNLLWHEDSYVEKLACELSLTPATVCYHLKKMEAAGLVKCSRSQFYIIYSVFFFKNRLFIKSFAITEINKNKTCNTETHCRKNFSRKA